MSPPLLWCAVCAMRRVPLVEDGTCGWCGESSWHGRLPEAAWPVDTESPVTVRAPFGPVPDVLRDVLREAAAAAGLTVDDILAKTRDPYVCRIRKLAMCEARSTGASYPAIGRAFRRNHSTVMHAVKASGSGSLNLMADTGCCPVIPSDPIPTFRPESVRPCSPASTSCPPNDYSPRLPWLAA